MDLPIIFIETKIHQYEGTIEQGSDSFFTQTEPETKPVGYELVNKWNAYEKSGATSSSMEDAPIFSIAPTLNSREHPLCSR